MQGTDPEALSRTLQSSYIAANRYARGVGRTTWACNSLAVNVKRSEPGAFFAWMVPRLVWSEHIVPRILDVFKEHGIDGWRRIGPNELKDRAGRHILLFVPDMADSVLRGREVFEVDDLGEARDSLDVEGRWKEWMTYKSFVKTRTRAKLMPLRNQG